MIKRGLIKLRKIKTSLILVLLLVLCVSFTASANENIRIFVDGRQVEFPDQKPFVDKNNRTLVPVRFISEALGAKVDWDPANKQVTVSHEGQCMEIKLWIGKKTYEVNGVKKEMDSEAIITPQKRTMVPMRFVSEGLGVYVDYMNIEGLGLIFNFTWDFPEESIKETVERIKEEVKNEFQKPDEPVGEAKPFKNEGKPPWGSGGQVMFVEYDELPVATRDYTINGAYVEGDRIIVEFTGNRGPGVISLLKEKDEILVNRNTVIDESLEGKHAFRLRQDNDHIMTGNTVGSEPNKQIKYFAVRGTSEDRKQAWVVFPNPNYEGGN